MSKALRLSITLGTGLALAVAAVLFFSLLPSLGKEPASAQEIALTNDGFEGAYENWEGSDARKIAPSWRLWYTTDWPDEQHIAPPHAGEEKRSDRVRAGKSQAVFSDGTRNFDACLYQQISGITVGHYVKFGIWSRVDTSMAIPEAQTRVGIDPNGGTNPRDIQYELNQDKWDVYTAQSGEWQRLSVLIKSISPTVTVYACSHPRWAIRLESYWDDATFIVTPESFLYLPMLENDYFQLTPGELANPDLEKNWGTYEEYHVPIPGYGNVKIAPYWYPYWNKEYITDTEEQPEYGPTGLGAGYPYRSHSGQWAQQMGSSGGSNYEAGIYQVVHGVRPSDTLRFTMWAHGWTAYWREPGEPGPDERVSEYREPDGLNFKIGIDPYGGESYTSTNIVWSEEHDPYDEWYQFEVTATAISNQISVWVYAHPSNPLLKSNESFWDDASLQAIESP